jgi:photoactive yellow protein
MSIERETLLGVSELSPEDFDKLPFGAIVIDKTGLIIAYNEYESQLAHLPKKRVVGKNFFRHVAPCTGVQAFEGRMHEFLATEDAVSESFEYNFPFDFGAVDVSITFVRYPDRKSILIAVERIDHPGQS